MGFLLFFCKSVEEYGKKIAKEAAKEEKTKNIIALLNKGMSVEWIHDTLDIPINLIKQIESSLKTSK